MKKLSYLFLFSLLFLMVGCLDKSEEHYTPRIANSVFVRNQTDTLLLHVIDSTQQIVLDTIMVGDTVRCMAAYSSLGNNLTSAKVGWEKEYIDLQIHLFDELRAIMLGSSDTLNGIINLPAGYYYLSLPIEFRALQAGSPNLVFTVESDSKFSPVSKTIVVPIR